MPDLEPVSNAFKIFCIIVLICLGLAALLATTCGGVVIWLKLSQDLSSAYWLLAGGALVAVLSFLGAGAVSRSLSEPQVIRRADVDDFFTANRQAFSGVAELTGELLVFRNGEAWLRSSDPRALGRNNRILVSDKAVIQWATSQVPPTGEEEFLVRDHAWFRGQVVKDGNAVSLFGVTAGSIHHNGQHHKFERRASWVTTCA